MEYIALDNFSASDLTLEEGQKTNGYKVLTKEPKVVNQEYLEEQTATIDEIMANDYYDKWPKHMKELTSNFVGMAKITKQVSDEERRRKAFLINSVKFMGDSEADLNAKKGQYESLKGGEAREINLNNLHMMGTGYVYSTVNTMEKVVSESALPYVSVEFLENAGKLDTENANALKIINNDHVFTAFPIDKSTFVEGEEEALALRNEYFQTSGNDNKTAYYNYLVSRVDQLRQYPTMTFKANDENYSGYIIDSIEDGDQKIIVMVIKDYINAFANEIIIETEVNIEQFDCYKIPQSAVFKKDGKTYIKAIEKDYFEELIPVTVYKYEKGNAILKINEENTDISEGMMIKIYP